MIDAYNSLFLIFLKFYNNQCPDYFNEVFCPVDDNGVATRYCDKKLKLPFRKSKLGMQSLSYVGPSTWNNLPNNLKTLRHETEADIYSIEL